MSFTVDDFEDLLRILEQEPNWLVRLRSLVLPEEFQSLPAAVRELAVAQRLMTAAIHDLVAAQDRTETRLIELTAGQARTDARLVDLVDRTETRFTEMAAAQARTDAAFAEMATAQAHTAARLADLADRTQASILELVAAQRSSDARIDRLADLYQRLATDVDWLKGESLEFRYQRHSTAYFGRILRRSHVLTEDERGELLEVAEQNGLLSRAEVEDISLADLLVRGRRAQEEVYLVVEVSWTIDEGDVTRATRRAALLSRTGVGAVPVVAGTALATGVTEQAHAAGVWQITNGHVIAPA